MTPAGPVPGPRRGPHIAGQAIHELDAIGTEPAVAQPPPTNQVTAVPDLLDDEAMTTSQALVPVENNSSAIVAAPPPAAAPEQQTEAAPIIAGIGRIERNNAPRRAPKKRERIIVPEKSINGGLDFKFEPDPYNIDLCDLLTAEDYTDSITTLNDTLRPSRSKTVDTGLLITGPLILPLAVWGARHSRLVKKRKLLLVKGIMDFNDCHPTLYMHYNRTQSSSFLTIERRKEEHSTMMTGVEGSWMDREPVV